MVTFNSDKISDLVSRKRTATTVNYAFFSCLLLLALACAALTPDSEKHLTAFITCWCLFALFLIGFICVNLFYTRKLTQNLKSLVAAVIADAFKDNEHILNGDKEIELNISADGDILSVARKGYMQPVTISATGGGLKCEGSLKFDLESLKRVGSIYSAACDYIWQYLTAYYFINGRGKYVSVIVCDQTAKPPQTLPIVSLGVPAEPKNKNVFLKLNLIKQADGN